MEIPMKKINLLVTAVLLIALTLTACAPGIQTEEPSEPTETLTPSEVPEQPTEPAASGGVEEFIGKQAYIADQQATEEALKALANANNSFALDLYKQLSNQEGNLFYSPYSIYQALLMTYAGAENATASQMESALHLPYSDDEIHEVMNALSLQLKASSMRAGEPAFAFNVANALWGQQGYSFLPEFLDILSANYGAGLKAVDFANDPEAAREMINLWVAAQTNEKIKGLIPAGTLNELTRLVLTNAVYFKAAWQTQFDPADTAEGSFTLLDGSVIQVPMIHRIGNMNAAVESGVKLVELPYEGGMYSMVILMPEAGSLEEFEQSLDQQKLESILGTLGNASVNLTMPKFKIESAFGLAEQMEKLGMVDAFDENLADFSGMNGSKELYISSLIHKAYVNVNEEGTEAAAATAVVMDVTSAPMNQYDITIDNPFLFLIRENSTGTIVFMGRVVEP